MANKSKCGYIVIIGRPNVGKSTLLNRLLGRKLSITSHKPQTTRYQILGIKTQDNVQAIFVDTPGIHSKAKNVMNRFMNRAAVTMIGEVDVIVFMIDARTWAKDDDLVLKHLKQVYCPVILVLNKVDLMKHKEELLPKLEELAQKLPFVDVLPVSVTKDVNVNELEKLIYSYLPENEHFFPDDQLTDKDDHFLISEIVREKLMRVTSQEVPYGTAVVVESIKKEEKIIHIDVIIWVARRGQKVIVIGKKGEKLKEIGKQARHDLEKMLNSKVYLTLWVKVKTGWVDDKRSLHKLGFN